MGNKLENCRKGIAAIPLSNNSRIIETSKFYKTSPVDYTDQDWFINAAIKIETRLDPFQLLKELKSIEQKRGPRDKKIRFGPRTLDLDIVFYDDIVLNSEKIVIPHPRMHKRRFVLRPICDIDPGIIHPVYKKDVQSLLNNLKDKDEVICLD